MLAMFSKTCLLQCTKRNICMVGKCDCTTQTHACKLPCFLKCQCNAFTQAQMTTKQLKQVHSPVRKYQSSVSQLGLCFDEGTSAGTGTLGGFWECLDLFPLWTISSPFFPSSNSSLPLLTKWLILDSRLSQHGRSNRGR